MNNIKINSYAKLNLTLEIGQKLSNNYHELNSIFHQIDLHDTISIKKLKQNKIIIKSNLKEIENKNNLAYREASLIKRRYKIKEGIEIKISKNIPICSGLGGGSSNAASTLTALNKLFKLKLSKIQLKKLAAELGSDVPYFIEGKSCLVEGIGNKVKKINTDIKLNFLIIKPKIGVSTKEAYNLLDRSREDSIIKKKPLIFKNNNIIDSLKNKNIKKITENLHNDFESVIIEKYPIIKKIKKDLIKNNALNALMTGSGSAVFGIFRNNQEAKKAYSVLSRKYDFVQLSKTLY